MRTSTSSSSPSSHADVNRPRWPPVRDVGPRASPRTRRFLSPSMLAGGSTGRARSFARSANQRALALAFLSPRYAREGRPFAYPLESSRGRTRRQARDDRSTFFMVPPARPQSFPVARDTPNLNQSSPYGCRALVDSTMNEPPYADRRSRGSSNVPAVRSSAPRPPRPEDMSCAGNSATRRR